MLNYQGKGVTKAVAVGRLRLQRKAAADGADAGAAAAGTPAEEKEIFLAAKAKAMEQLTALYEQALAEVGEKQAEIFVMHQGMLDDFDLNEAIEEAIADGAGALQAVTQAGEMFASMFACSEEEYLRARAADVRDVVARLQRCLAGTEETVLQADESFVLVAEDLTPSDTLQLDRSKLLGFVTAGGSTTSHTAILARSLGLPAVVATGLQVDELQDGQEIIVDGEQGIVIVEPEAEMLAHYRQRAAELAAERELLEAQRGLATETKSGRRIELAANIGSVADAELAFANDAESIGLFRSEFLFLGRETMPSEEEQLKVYRQVLEKAQGRRVVIRTLDIGADKKVDYLNLPAEENPALGCRAVRLCLQRPELFCAQLRALCRASVYGRLAIMVPMIISRAEVLRVKELLAEVKAELRAEGIALAEKLEFGIMIETPAAAICSAELAQEVDFFSLGTNDLTQYTLALDRQNAGLEEFLDRHHPAVLQLIGLTIKHAKEAGIKVCICGELGADPELTETFIRWGVDELSVTPVGILPLRARIRALD